MKRKLKLYSMNLRLFDGAAASGAAPAAPSGQAAGDGAVQTGDSITTSSDTGKKKGDLSNVKYGKQPENTIPDSQEATQAAAETTVETTDTLEAKKAEFEKLIQGDYKDLFDERIHGIINNRFKETKTLESKLSSMNPILEKLASKYGVPAEDINMLTKAIDEDDSYYEDEALEKGLTVSQLKEVKRLERENAEFRRSQAEIEARRNAEQTYNKWLTDSEVMKQKFPGFDLKAEMKNEDFMSMLKKGVNVEAAYKVIHHDEIVSGIAQKTAQNVATATVNNIKSRSQRPAENGVSTQGGAIVKPNVSDLSMADVMEIARRAKLGETIRF